METQIFKDYSDFLKREDKQLNGVSKEFAKEYPNYEIDNESNEGCWNCSYCRSCRSCRYCSDCSYCRSCRYCSDCSDCSYCSDCSDCSYCRSCRYCSYCRSCRSCRYCSDCSDCIDCSYCRDCSYCSYCSDCRSCRSCRYCSYCSDCNKLGHGNNNREDKANSWFKVPKIENIHTKILEATSKEGALNMEKWHTCDTTHCRAGWVEFLAGKEGKELADKTSTLFAAMHIYKESSEIHVGCNKFFDTNELAMADIKRCAELEAQNNK